MAKKKGKSEAFPWPDGDPSFERWKAHVLKNLIPKIEGSNIFVSLTPSDKFKTDVKFAVELGFAIMYNKPIIAVVPPGTEVPEKLIKVADRIVELDLNMEDSRRRLMEVLKEMIREQGGDSNNGIDVEI
jgi:hypothetical protein